MIVFQTTTKADCRQMVVDCVFMFSADSDKGNEWYHIERERERGGESCVEQAISLPSSH